MLRKLLLALSVLAIAVPLMAYPTTWDGAASGDILWNLTVPGYIQINWQEQNIAFLEDGSDWYADQLEGVAYDPIAGEGDGQQAMWAWAGDDWYAGATGKFYETAQGGQINLHSNCALTMTVTPQGLLTGDVHGETLPSWYTAALGTDFILDDVVLDGTLGTGGNGQYLFDLSPGLFGHDEDGGGQNYPTQHPFPFDDGARSLSMDPEIQGTVKFLGRVHRHGMADRADDYKTKLEVAFTSP